MYYNQQPRIQGQGFYNPLMPGPDYGQGFREMFERAMQMDVYKKEQAQKQKQEQVKREQWEKEYELEKQRIDATTKPKQIKPTTRDDRIAYAAPKVESGEWDTDKAIYFIATGKEKEKPLTLSNKQIKFAVDKMGYTPAEVKNFNDKQRLEVYGTWESWNKPSKEGVKKPPISQPGLIGVARRRAKETATWAARQSGVDMANIPPDAGIEWLLAQASQNEKAHPALEIAQAIDGALSQYEVTLSDREMSPQEKKTVQKYVSFLGDLKRIFQKDPNATAEKVLSILEQYINK